MGPGRPVRSRSNAPAMAVGIARASVSASAQRATGRKHSIWFGTSCRAPRSRPTRSEAMSEAISTTGTEPAYDSTRGVRALVAPGPVVTSTTPGSPEARA